MGNTNYGTQIIDAREDHIKYDANEEYYLKVQTNT